MLARADELAGGLPGVASYAEGVLYATLAQPCEYVLEVRLIPYEPGGEVWRRLVAPLRQPLGEIQRAFDALLRRGRHRELDVLGDVLDDLLLGPLEWDHLVPGSPQGLGDRLRRLPVVLCSLPHHALPVIPPTSNVPGATDARGRSRSPPAHPRAPLRPPLR